MVGCVGDSYTPLHSALLLPAGKEFLDSTLYIPGTAMYADVHTASDGISTERMRGNIQDSLLSGCVKVTRIVVVFGRSSSRTFSEAAAGMMGRAAHVNVIDSDVLWEILGNALSDIL